MIYMSQFAYFRFMSNNMLTVEEQQHKDEIITLTEQVLDAKGIECDSKISKISQEQLREILEGVRKLRKRNKKKIEEEEGGDDRQKEELDIAPID
jgi:CRISPR/Cas system CMR-associated protein Cmr3 (group 5 of RAMP superfamily)